MDWNTNVWLEMTNTKISISRLEHSSTESLAIMVWSKVCSNHEVENQRSIKISNNRVSVSKHLTTDWHNENGRNDIFGGFNHICHSRTDS